MPLLSLSDYTEFIRGWGPRVIPVKCFENFFLQSYDYFFAHHTCGAIASKWNKHTIVVFFEDTYNPKKQVWRIKFEPEKNSSLISPTPSRKPPHPVPAQNCNLYQTLRFRCNMAIYDLPFSDVKTIKNSRNSPSFSRIMTSGSGKPGNRSPIRGDLGSTPKTGVFPAENMSKLYP